MTSALSEKVRVCIAIESTTAEIYHQLAGKFTEARILWRDLALSEENHANLLIVGAGYLRTGELPESVVPNSQDLIDETFRLVRNAKEEITKDHASVEDIFSLALKIEKSTAESYFQQLMMSEADSPVIAKMQKLRMDELTHIEKIENFMKAAGLDYSEMN